MPSFFIFRWLVVVAWFSHRWQILLNVFIDISTALAYNLDILFKGTSTT